MNATTIGRPCTTLHDELAELAPNANRLIMQAAEHVRRIAAGVTRRTHKRFSVTTVNERVTRVRRVA